MAKSARACAYCGVTGTPLRDAAVVNATRRAPGHSLGAAFPAVRTAPGGRTDPTGSTDGADGLDGVEGI
ncbi:hypothetical protein ACWGDE_08410 [Streptomyces sp. NPDC054956]